MDEPIKILQIGMHDKIGGVETFLMNYYRNIDKTKFQFDFICMFDKLCFENEILDLGGNIYKVPNVKKNPISYYREIKRVIKRNDYKIVHINMLSNANILPIIAAKSAGVKNIIVHSHNANIPKGIARYILDKINRKIVLKNATHFFACSKKAGDWMFGKNFKYIIINNAVDVKKFKYNEIIRKKIRQDLNVEDKFVIGHIGRFSEQKNHKLLIKIFIQFLRENKNTVLLTIGEGELKNDIEEMVKQNNIEDKVILLNPVSNVNDYLQAMDVFILPSKFEGLPVVAVEAQTSGLNVIASDTISKEIPIRELTKYCCLDNIDMWCEAIKNIDKKRIDRESDIVKANYSIYEETKKLQKLYKLMIEKEI